jgi:plastocyanin
MRRLFIFIVMLALAGAAQAADLTISVRTKYGTAVPDAVVTFQPATAKPGSIKFDWPYRLEQKNIQFSPRALIVPVGATVLFPNLDKVRHHVYSFSTGNKFELKLFGKDETHSYTFKTVGIAAVGCNIHDQMSAYIAIVDTPYAALTNASGVATLRNVSGDGELRVWRQDLRAPGNRWAKAFKMSASDAAKDVVIELRPAAVGAMPGMVH